MKPTLSPHRIASNNHQNALNRLQIGGQGHLDLMPWYVKFAFVLGLAMVTVAGTASAVGHERVWNAKTIASALIALVLLGGMGAVTYYYHLHENDDADSGDESDVAVLHWANQLENRP